MDTTAAAAPMGHDQSIQFPKSDSIMQNRGRIPGERSENLHRESERMAPEPSARPADDQAHGTPEMGPNGECIGS